MAKASVYIVIFLISFNAGGVMLQSTGVADELGLNADPGSTDELEQAEQQGENFDVGGGAGQTLFGLYASLAGVLETIFNAVMPGAAMLKRAGVPDFYVNFAFAFAAMIPVFDVASYLRSGGDLL